MKKIFTFLGLLTALLALVLSVLPLSNLAFIPGLASLVFGAIALVAAMKSQSGKKTIHLALLLALIAISISGYKALFGKAEMGNIQEFEQKDEEAVEKAKEQLESQDLDIDIPEEAPDTSNDF